VLRGAEKHVIF